MSTFVFHKGDYNATQVFANRDLTGETIIAQIREFKDVDSDLIVDWAVDVTDAAAGEIELSYNDTAGTITHSKGFMDVKRVTGSGHISLFDEPLVVEFRGTVSDA